MKMKRRLLALIITVLMVVQLLPASLMVTAADVSYTHNFTTQNTESEFFTITGNLSTGKGSVEYNNLILTQCLKMESSTNISFEAPADGTLTLVFGGTTNATGKTVKVDGTKYTLDDTQILTLSLTAGSHTVLKGDSINLFYMEYSHTSSEAGGNSGGEGSEDQTGTSTTTTYSFAAATDVTVSADKETIVAGTTYEDGYFKVVGTVTGRVSSGSCYAVEVGKNGTGGMEFTVTGTAGVTVTVSSTGGSNTSAVGLIDAEGKVVANNEQITEVTGTSATTMTYTALPAGTYQVVSPQSDHDRGCRVMNITVVQTTAGTAPETPEEEPATSWDFTADEYTGQTSYNGLIINGSPAKHDSTYGMRVKSATIDVPVSGPCEIQVTVGYNWDITFPDGSSFTHESSAPVVYKYTGEAGTVAITVGDSCTSYIAKIELAEITEPATSWDFTADEYTGQTSYNGLIINGSPAKHDSTYGMRVKSATIDVPVSGPCEIQVTVGYNWDITFPDGSSFTHESSAPVVYKYTGEAGTVAITVGDSCTSYIAKIELAELPAEEEPDAPVVQPDADTTKIYVWDFAGEQLDTDTYINMIDADEINSWFDGVEAGTTGKNLVSFTTSDGQLSFNDGGATGAHRLRVNVSGITCYDTGKYLQDADGNVYNGYIYSNKGADATVYISIQANAGDILTFVLCSNGTQYTANLEAPSGAVQTAQHTPANNKDAQIVTFYAAETGAYKLYYTQEKMVVARIYRQSNAVVSVSGSVSAPADLSQCVLVFTNTATGAQTTATVENGSYSVSLYENYTYEVSLQDANGYIITSTDTLTIAKGATSATLDVTVEAVPMVSVSGNIEGLSAEALAKLQLKLVADAVYVPVVAINGSAYSVMVELGQEYTLVAEGVNDYVLTGSTTVSYTENTTANIVFTAKPTYAVTIVPEGCEVADLANATFTFTNLNEEGYVYTFTGTDAIVLRDGTYSVAVKNVNGYVQKRTSNLTVNGAAVSKTIGFEVPTVWDFRTDDYTGQSSYNGVTITGSFGKHGANYGMQIKDGTVTIPVSGACEIMISVGYTWDITVPDGTNHLNTSDSNAVLTYSYTGGAGNVVLTIGNGATTYIRYIELKAAVAYKETVTVGASGCDYTTIGDAMEAVRAMNRPNNERVTILIQPGNYEEMLVVDVPNVTLKNASENPSIGLTDKGVGIDENAVRITWYYGHGYTYYSMGNDCKFDAELLQINKENGYASFENPGSGTTAGSYWNATVVITADGFRAEGIIFENSFNQYVSAMAANDVIVAQASAKEPSGAPRASLAAGSTAVQDKAYVERAAALAIANNCNEVYFENCKFVGRQDTLYGGTGVSAAFYDCAVYGGTDYIFGGMTAVFAKCDLVFNTSDDSKDVGYITAPQTQSGSHGILLYNCTITSTVPGVDTASTYTSKPGYFGRPWAANTGEAVFYCTVIEAADAHWSSIDASLIRAAGWLSTLSGESVLCGEYGTVEQAQVDHSTAREGWAQVFATAELASGEPISIETWLGTWDAFAGKDLTVDTTVEPDDGNTDEGGEDPDEGGDDYTGPTVSQTTQHTFNSLIHVTPGADKDAIASGTTYADDYFTVVGTVTQRYDAGKGGVYAIEIGKNLTGAMEFTVTGTADVTIVVSSTSGSNTSAVAIINKATGEVISNNEGLTTVSGTSATTLTYTGLAAGVYQIVSPENEELNRGFRLMTIDVFETVEVPVEDDNTGDDNDVPTITKTFKHSFNSLKDVTPGADKDAIAAGTTYDDGYFTVVGSVTQRYDAEKGGVYAIELGKGMSGGLEFTVTGTAKVTITVSSTGGSNTSTIAIINAVTGQVMTNVEGLSTVDGTSATTLTYVDLEAGTYRIVSPTNDEYKRGTRLMTVDVVEKVEVPDDGSDTTPETGDLGIALAAAMLMLSATAVVILPRKKEF